MPRGKRGSHGKAKVEEPARVSLARALQFQLDRVAFATDALGFTPDPWQAEVLRSTSRYVGICAARQSGKSDVVSVLALHCMIYRPGSEILIISPSERQSIEVLHKINTHRARLALDGKPVEDNKMTLELENGSRILSLPASEKTTRGFSAINLLIEDEAGDVPDELHEAVEPMLQVSRGRMVLMGTPKGPRGHFAEMWRDGEKKTDGGKWHRVFSTAWDNPRVPRADLEALREEKTRLGRLFWFQQEYECKFLASGQGLVYPYETEKNVLPRRLPLHRHFGWQYALGIDYGYTDHTAFVVLGWQEGDPTLYVIESFKKQGLLPSDAADIAKVLTNKYPFARIVGDAGGLGKPYVEEARRRLRIPIEYAEKNNKRGYIELFVGDLKSGNIKVFPGNEELLAEWQILPWDEDRALPADGYEDHLSDAALYAWRCCYAYVETVRKAGPKRGTPEFDEREAQDIFERRMSEVSRVHEEGGWQREENPQWNVVEADRSFFH